MTSRPTPGRRVAAIRARRALERDYDRLHDSTVRAVAGKLRGTGVLFDPADLDAHYNHAWHALHARMLAGEAIENPGGFLTQAAYFRAVDQFRKEHVDRRSEVAEIVAPTADVEARLDDADRLRAFTQGLRERLRGRDLRAAALCYLHGYSRAEAAAELGVTAPQMKKTMDRVSRTVTELLGDLRAGSWCEDHRSLMTAYALNVLDPDGERVVLARAHLAGCAGCRALVRTLRGITAVAPPVPLTSGLAATAGAGAATAAATPGAGAGAGPLGGAPAPGVSGGVGPGVPWGVAAPAVAVAATAVLVVGLGAALRPSGGADRGAAERLGATPSMTAAARPSGSPAPALSASLAGPARGRSTSGGRSSGSGYGSGFGSGPAFANAAPDRRPTVARGPARDASASRAGEADGSRTAEAGRSGVLAATSGAVVRLGAALRPRAERPRPAVATRPPRGSRAPVPAAPSTTPRPAAPVGEATPPTAAPGGGPAASAPEPVPEEAPPAVGPPVSGPVPGAPTPPTDPTPPSTVPSPPTDPTPPSTVPSPPTDPTPPSTDPPAGGGPVWWVPHRG